MRKSEAEAMGSLAAAALDTAGVLVVVADGEGRMQWANQACRDVLGLGTPKLAGRGLWDLAAIDSDAERMEELHGELAAGQASVSGESVWATSRGPRVVAWTSTRVEDPRTGAPHVVCIGHDVTPQRRVQQALRASEEKFRNLVERTSDWVWEVDENAIYTYASPRIRDLLGYEPEEVVGKTPFDLMAPAEAERVRAIFEPIARAHQPFTLFNNTLCHRDGYPVEVETNGAPIFDAEGSFRGYRGTDRDVTERHRAEERLRASEANYRALFDSANDAIFVHDARTGAITDVNQKAQELYGYTAEEMRLLDVEALSVGEPPYTQQDALRHIRAAVLGEPQVFEWLAKDRLGRRFWVEVSLKRVALGGCECLLAIVRDVTARKQADQLLDEARQRLLESEVEKKRFYREVVRAVTHGKLHLVDAAEIPAEGCLLAEIALDDARQARGLRHQLRRLAEDAGMVPEAIQDLVLAASEAATNAIKHAHGAFCSIHGTPDRLIVRVSDLGAGIRAEDLPGAVLLPGFSTEVSLGMGYTIMLQLMDAVWLATGPEGTVVQIEKWLHPEAHPAAHLAAWQRL